jgi:hypothetical protein
MKHEKEKVLDGIVVINLFLGLLIGSQQAGLLFISWRESIQDTPTHHRHTLSVSCRRDTVGPTRLP